MYVGQDGDSNGVPGQAPQPGSAGEMGVDHVGAEPAGKADKARERQGVQLSVDPGAFAGKAPFTQGVEELGLAIAGEDDLVPAPPEAIGESHRNTLSA
jgi:hypothetical protein